MTGTVNDCAAGAPETVSAAPSLIATNMPKRISLVPKKTSPHRRRQPFQRCMSVIATRAVVPMWLALLSACTALPTASPPSVGTSGEHGMRNARTVPATPMVSNVSPPPSRAERQDGAPAEVPMMPIDRQPVLRAWVDQQSRLYRVAAPLLFANTQLCPRHAKRILGFTAKNKYSYSTRYIAAAKESLGLDDRLQVMDVFAGSGAAEVGLRQGDILVAIEIEPLPEGPDAEQQAAALIGAEMRGRDVLQLTVLREDERIILDISPTSACAMVIALGDAEIAASYTDGHRVLITRGMLDAVQSNEELAYVVAQAMARNVVIPGEHDDVAALIDGLRTLDNPAAWGAARPMPVATADVDEFALHLLARSGYAIEGYPTFWARIATPIEKAKAAVNKDKFSVSDRHMEKLNLAIQAIRSMQAAGVPVALEASGRP